MRRLTPTPSPMQPRRLFTLALVFAVIGCAGFAVDFSVSTFFMESDLPGDLRTGVRLAEVFAHGLGVALICLTVFVLDPENRRRIPRLLGCTFLAGLAALIVKQVVARQRPQTFRDGETVAFPATVWETFTGWLPSFTQHAQATERAIQSFPSGHTATAVGLAIGLSWLYPRGKWLFAFFALLAACQRIDSGAHFVSDTCFAAALACLIGGTTFGTRSLGRVFDRLEGAPSASPQSREAPGLTSPAR